MRSLISRRKLQNLQYGLALAVSDPRATGLGWYWQDAFGSWGPFRSRREVLLVLFKRAYGSLSQE